MIGSLQTVHLRLPLSALPLYVQLITIDLLHFLIIVLEVLVIVLALCVLELSTVIRRHLLPSPRDPRTLY